MKKTLLVLLLLFLSFGLFGCESEEDETPEVIHEIPDEPYINIQDLPYAEYLNLTNPVVTITVKDMGDIVLHLFPIIAPNTVRNFIANIEAGVYTDNEFHRVINDFMIQGGKLDNPPCTIAGEMGGNEYPNPVVHDRGVLSMARVPGDYNSQSSQFFIMHAKSNTLNNEYSTFGGMVSGFNVLDYIAYLNELAEIDDANSELPNVPVYIESITVDLKGISYSAPIWLD